MPTKQEMNGMYQQLTEKSDDPGPLVMTLKELRAVPVSDTTRTDVSDFLRSNQAEDDKRLLQLSFTDIKFL